MFEADKITDRNDPAKTMDQFELSNADFARLGMPSIVYVRPFEEGGVEGFQVCSADGRVVGLFASHDQAVGTALQQDLTPLSVH